jgi:hypothetical protein
VKLPLIKQRLNNKVLLDRTENQQSKISQRNLMSSMLSAPEIEDSRSKFLVKKPEVKSKSLDFSSASQLTKNIRSKVAAALLIPSLALGACAPEAKEDYIRTPGSDSDAPSIVNDSSEADIKDSGNAPTIAEANESEYVTGEKMDFTAGRITLPTSRDNDMNFGLDKLKEMVSAEVGSMNLENGCTAAENINSLIQGLIDTHNNQNKNMQSATRSTGDNITVCENSGTLNILENQGEKSHSQVLSLGDGDQSVEIIYKPEIKGDILTGTTITLKSKLAGDNQFNFILPIKYDKPTDLTQAYEEDNPIGDTEVETSNDSNESQSCDNKELREGFFVLVDQVGQSNIPVNYRGSSPNGIMRIDLNRPDDGADVEICGEKGKLSRQLMSTSLSNFVGNFYSNNNITFKGENGTFIRLNRMSSSQGNTISLKINESLYEPVGNNTWKQVQ